MILYVLAVIGIFCFGSYACLMFNLLKELIKAVNSLNDSIRSIKNTTPIVNNHYSSPSATQITPKFQPSSVTAGSDIDMQLMKDLAQFEKPKEDIEVKLNLESKKTKLDSDAQAALDFLKRKDK